MSKFIKKENSLLGEVYYHALHESGLNVYVIPKEFSTCYATLTAKYGSIDNKFRFVGDESFTEVPNGIAHFLEHKMFENEDGTDAFLRYGATGAEANAFTSFLKTSYLFSCTERFNESLEILLETVTKPYFTQETVAKEQGIIGEEIGMMNDNPGWVLTFNMLAGMYREHSVKINIAGSAESIAEIDADTLYKCYDIFYQPSNMVLIACGKVDPDEILAAVDKIMPKREPRPFESVYAEEEDRVVTGYVEAKMDVARPVFSIGIKDTDISPEPAKRLRKSAALSVILETMFGPSSPIYNELYEQGRITGTLSCDYEHNRAFSFLEISGESEECDPVISRIIDYTEEIKESGLDPMLFERAKKVVYAQTLKGFDSTEDINSMFLSNIVDGVDAFDLPEALAELSKEECDALVRRLFREEARTVSVIKPKKG